METSAILVPTVTDHFVCVIGKEDSSDYCLWWNLQNYFDLTPGYVYFLPVNSTRAVYCPLLLGLQILESHVCFSLTTKVRGRDTSFVLFTLPREILFPPSTNFPAPFIIANGFEESYRRHSAKIPRAWLEGYLRLVPGHNLIVKAQIYLDDFLMACTSFSSLSNDLMNLFYKEILPDLRLVKGRSEVPAHKCIMAARSGVFNSVLATGESVIDMEQILPENVFNVPNPAFVAAVWYAYTGVLIDLKPEMAVPMYLVAQALEMPDLEAVCSQCLTNRITVPSFLGVLNLALGSQMQAVRGLTTDFFMANKEELMQSIFPEDGQTMVAPPWITAEERVVLEAEIRRLYSLSSPVQDDQDTAL